jgi:heavy metal translocating P-type ATPase
MGDPTRKERSARGGRAGDAPGERLRLEVGGMHCADCALNIERSIRHISGVLDANVDYVMGTAVVRFDPYRVSPERIRRAVERPGYTIADSRITQASSWLGRNRLRLTAGISGACLAASWAVRILQPESYAGPASTGAVLALAAVAVGGLGIFLNAIRTVLTLDTNVNVLVTAAAAAAVAMGDYVEAGTVVFILVLGEMLEDFAVRKAKRAISGLIEVTPKSARVRRDGREIDVPADAIAVGDVVLVRPGERVPVDGTVISGSGSIDESTITGEPVPAEVAPGAQTYSGTVCATGYIELRASKVSSDSTLAKIKRLVQEAQAQRAPVQTTMIAMSRYFVPAVFAVAAATYAVTGAAERAITVLIVACPCALVLGTPTAVVAGLGRAARKGILIKGGAFLEGMGRVTAVLLDKTGTLTEGAPKVVEAQPVGDHTEDELVRIAASVERMSAHPLAGAIVGEASRRGLKLEEAGEFTVDEGLGVSASLGKGLARVGSARYMDRMAVSVPEEIVEKLGEDSDDGRTPVLAALDNSLCGVLWVWDPPREGAGEAVRELKRIGVGRVVLLTGDNRRSATRAAEMVGIGEVSAEMLPHEKLEWVRSLKAEGHRVAVVGDGVNDAPALAAADVGIAMGARGTDVAMETADVALMADDLSRVPEAISLGRRTIGVIRQNAAFAIAFNLAMVGLAAWGTLGMIGGALVHQVSSLGVILNSMRLFIGRRDGVSGTGPR